MKQYTTYKIIFWKRLSEENIEYERRTLRYGHKRTPKSICGPKVTWSDKGHIIAFTDKNFIVESDIDPQIIGWAV